MATTNATAVAGKDYKGITKQEVAFGTGDSTKIVTVNLYADAESDDNENFYLELFKSEQDLNNGVAATQSKAFIKNVSSSIDNYTYTITSSHLTKNTALEEGNDLTFTITRSGSSGTTKVYLNTYRGMPMQRIMQKKLQYQ